MKTKQDPRHQHRIKLVKKLFAISFQNQRRVKQPTLPIINKLKQIDKLICQSAPSWPLDKIAKIDLAILRLSIYELLQQKEPKKVIIDEAIELAKEFGSEKSSKFINGALASVVNNVK